MSVFLYIKYMIWKRNKNKALLIEVADYINADKLEKRICSMLNIDTKTLYKKISKDEVIRLTANILANRNLTTKEKVEAIFNTPSLSLKNPNNLVNANNAVELIIANKDKKTYIYADYDVDGIMSGYIMYHALKTLNFNVEVHFPERREGYGLSESFVNEIEDNSFVITVDNGITKINEVEILKKKNCTVLITDHHQSQDSVPDCLIVDPWNMFNEDKDNQHLCGTSVAFKIIQILFSKFDKSASCYVPYVCLATLADVMPLVPENIAYIQYGLDMINKGSSSAITALMEANNIDVLTSSDILWTLAPQINACGRMGKTFLAGRFFIEPDEDDVVNIIRNNDARKAVTKNAIKEISKLDYSNDQVCIFIADNYQSGILGIIAGKMVDQFDKVSIVAKKKEDNLYHGSIRSNGIDMISLLKEMKEKNLIESYGGHAGACVCAFRKEKIDAIESFFNSNVTYPAKEEAKEETIVIDSLINADYLNNIVYAIVNMLPCDGREYSSPLFCIRGTVNAVSHSKNDSSNIKLDLSIKDKRKQIWAWHFDEQYNALGQPKEIYLLGEIKKGFNKEYTLNVIDMKQA